MCRLELLTTLEQLAALRTEWDALLPQTATNEVFLTWEWQDAWWRAYQPGELFVIAGRNEQNQLVALAPWFIDLTNPDERVVRPIGCVEVTDYLDVIVHSEQRRTFFNALAEFLIEHKTRFDRINLCNLHGDSPTATELAEVLRANNFSVTLRNQEVCPIIALPNTFDKYLESLDKKNRHEARRKMRRAEGDEGNRVNWYVVGEQHDLQAELDKFLRLMAASHPSKAEFLADEKNAAFFKLVMPRMAACGWLQLSFLTVNDDPAATYLNFDYGGKIQVYNSGLVAETYSYLSPGIVLLLYNIQHAITLGRREFDFLRGNEEYKYRMGGQDRPVVELAARLESN